MTNHPTSRTRGYQQQQKKGEERLTSRRAARQFEHKHKNGKAFTLEAIDKQQGELIPTQKREGVNIGGDRWGTRQIGHEHMNEKALTLEAINKHDMKRRAKHKDSMPLRAGRPLAKKPTARTSSGPEGVNLQRPLPQDPTSG